jgi:hypothetical protein
MQKLYPTLPLLFFFGMIWREEFGNSLSYPFSALDYGRSGLMILMKRVPILKPERNGGESPRLGTGVLRGERWDYWIGWNGMGWNGRSLYRCNLPLKRARGVVRRFVRSTYIVWGRKKRAGAEWEWEDFLAWMD